MEEKGGRGEWKGGMKKRARWEGKKGEGEREGEGEEEDKSRRREGKGGSHGIHFFKETIAHDFLV